MVGAVVPEVAEADRLAEIAALIDDEPTTSKTAGK